jgi:hypothetical protein
MVFEIRDAIYGDIVLHDDEARLLDTYEMQRLRRIKQLGNACLVYPSANHSRFEHCLGTRWMAQKIVRISNLPIKKADERILYKCALLHDVAEPAYTHATERLNFQGFPTHEQIIDYVFDGTYKQKVLEKKTVDAKFICDVLTNKEEREEIKSILTTIPKKSDKPFMQELVKGYIDADVLDYLRRDSFFLGLPYGNYDDRIFASFRIIKFEGKEHTAFRDSQDTINAIMSILDSRYTLRRAAYLHHSVIIADDMFLEALNAALSDGTIDEYDVFICDDYELLAKMKGSIDASYFVDSLLNRNLFKRIYVIDSQAPYELKKRVESLQNNIAETSDLIQRLSEKGGNNGSRILLHFNPPSGWKDFDHILLVADDGTIRKLGEKLPGDLSLLKDKYDSLWRFMVSGNMPSQEARSKIADLCIEFFNYKGSFIPKKSYDEIRDLKKEIAPLISQLLKKVPASKAIFKILVDNNKPLSRDEIAKELNLKPATVSHYLTLINEELSKGARQIFWTKRIGRIKLWGIDERLREVLDDVSAQ